MSEAKETKLVAEIVKNKLQFTIEANDDDVNEEIFVSFTAPPVWDFIKDAKPVELSTDDTDKLTLHGETIMPDRSIIPWSKTGATSTYSFADGYQAGAQIQLTATSKTGGGNDCGVHGKLSFLVVAPCLAPSTGPSQTVPKESHGFETFFETTKQARLEKPKKRPSKWLALWHAFALRSFHEHPRRSRNIVACMVWPSVTAATRNLQTVVYKKRSF